MLLQFFSKKTCDTKRYCHKDMKNFVRQKKASKTFSDVRYYDLGIPSTFLFPKK